MKAQASVAQKIAEQKFKFEHQKEHIPERANNDILNKLESIEKLLKDLVDINKTALQLVINDSKENQSFFQKKQEK
jgi:hypothetical protein